MNRNSYSQERQSLSDTRKTKAQVTLKAAVAAVIASGRTVKSSRVAAKSVNWVGDVAQAAQ